MVAQIAVKKFKRTQRLHYIGWSSALALSLGLCFATENKFLDALGQTSAILSVGYGLGVAANAERMMKGFDGIDDLVTKQRLELEDKVHKSGLKVQTLADEKSKLEELLANVQTELEDFKANYESRWKAATDKLDDEVQKRVEKAYQGFLAKVKGFKSQHIKKEQYLIEELEKSHEALDIEKMMSQDALLELQAKFEELCTNYDQVLDSYHPELEQIKALFAQQLQSATAERDRIYQELQRYHQAKTFRGTAKGDINGNRLIDFFMLNGIVVDAVNVKSTFGYDEIWVKPRSVTLDPIKALSDAIHLEFELLKAPEFSIDQGCVKITLHNGVREKSETVKAVERPNWLEYVVQNSNHYRIVAPTGSGKSVFLDNLLNCFRLLRKELKVTLLDPKYPFSAWDGHQPDYEGFDECFEGMREIDRALEQRFKEAKLAKAEGKPLPDFDCHLFAIDELEMLIDDARDKDGLKSKAGKLQSELSSVLRKGLKLGRGVTATPGKGMVLAYITQSPLCSRIGLNVDDFDNSTNIWMGDTIAIALERELASRTSNAIFAQLKAEYNKRLEAEDTYFALVKMPNKNPFFAALPKHGEYAKKLQASEQSEDRVELASTHQPQSTPSLQGEGLSSVTTQQPTAPATLIQPPNSSVCCPQCGTFEVKKNGRRGNLQRYVCKDCKHAFTNNN